MQRVDTARFLGVTLDKRFTWSPDIDQARNRTDQRMGLLGPLLIRSEFSFSNGVLLYKQLIRLVMDSACPIWKSTARTQVRGLQVLQSKRHVPVTDAPWYLRNWSRCSTIRRHHSPDWELWFKGTRCGELLVRHISRPRVDPVVRRERKERRGPAETIARQWSSRLTNSARRWHADYFSDALSGGFPWFSSNVRQMPRYKVMQRQGISIPPPGGFTKVHNNCRTLQFATQLVRVQKPDSQPTSSVLLQH
jgi:hypothetical protein